MEPEVNLFGGDEFLVKVAIADFSSLYESLKVNLFGGDEFLVKAVVDFPSPDESLK